jgi:hypothetical protein
MPFEIIEAKAEEILDRGDSSFLVMSDWLKRFRSTSTSTVTKHGLFDIKKG